MAANRKPHRPSYDRGDFVVYTEDGREVVIPGEPVLVPQDRVAQIGVGEWECRVVMIGHGETYAVASGYCREEALERATEICRLLNNDLRPSD